MAGSKACPKCGRRMEQGVMLEAGDYDMPKIVSWIAGRPEKGWFGLKIDKEAKREVETWRCTSCHYLESYAP